MIRKIMLALAISSIALTATACNTVKGAGRDIESVGEGGDKVINQRQLARLSACRSAMDLHFNFVLMPRQASKAYLGIITNEGM